MIRRRCLLHTIGDGGSVAPLSSAWNIKRDLNQARFLRTRPLSSTSLGGGGAVGGTGGKEGSSPQNEYRDIGAARRWLPPGHPLAAPPARSWWSYPFMFSKWLFNRPVSDDVARSRKHLPRNEGGPSTKKKSAWNDAIRTGGVLLVLSLLWELAGAPRDALMRYTREVFYVTTDVNSSDPALFEALVCWLETQQRKEETSSMPVVSTGAGRRDKERDLEKKPAIHLFGNYFSVSEPLDAFLPEEGMGALSHCTIEPPQQPFSAASTANKEEGSSLYRVRHLPGLGLHRCRKDGHTLWFTRRPDEAKKRRSTIPSHQMAAGSGDPEWLTITVRRTFREVVRNTWYRCTGRVLASSTSSSTASCLSAKEVLDRLCEEALVAYRRTQQSKVSIYINEQGSYWELLCRKEPRDPGTLYFPEVIKSKTLDSDDEDGDGNDLTSRVAACTQLPPQEVSEEIGAFFRAALSYRALGLPWRRGYLFVGPPGTGKSSLILSLAGQHHVPVYLLSLKDPMLTDSSLLRAVNSIPPRSFVVLEDLDSVLLAAAPPSSSSNPSNGMLVGATLTDRGGPLDHGMHAAGGGGEGEGEDRGPTTHAPPLHQLSPSVTWSGLLNAVDGIGSSEGRVLFITTNEAPSHQPHYPTASNPSRSSAEGSGGDQRDPPPPQPSGGLLRVPPALLRPGRIDSCVTFSRWTGKDLAHLQQKFQRRLLLVEKAKEEEGKAQNTTQNISSSQLSVANEKRADATDGEAWTDGKTMTSWSPAMVQSLLVKEILDLHKGTRSSSTSS